MEPLVATISRTALEQNLRAIRARLGPGGVCAMVKADAYGHGLRCVAPVLVKAGVEFLAVARLEEAEQLRELGLPGPILLIEPLIEPSGDGWLADRLEAICRLPGLRVTVADAAGAAAAGRVARRTGVRLPVHLKIDSGMGRSGFRPESADDVLAAIDAAGSLDIEGVYTHLATADETDEHFAREQLARFGQLVERLTSHGRAIRYVHANNSAGLARFSGPAVNLARPGVALYGYHPDGATTLPDWALPLAPTLRLTGRMLLVRDLPAGVPVGYGCTWRTSRPSRVGLVPIGYGDGYSRCFGNRAVMQVAGRDVPVVGRVSMDLTTVDLTDLPEGGRAVRAGDEVTIISNRRSDANSVEGLARLADTIPYEITCRLSLRVRRELIEAFPTSACRPPTRTPPQSQ